jgi:hypothetical protein
MNCPTCSKNSGFIDYELLNQQDEIRWIGMLFYCVECNMCFSKRFSYKHKNPAFVNWLIKEKTKDCVPLPDKIRFKTERGFIL